MTDENTSENDKSSGKNRVSESINAVTGVFKAIPIYQDALQPAAKELGKGLEIIAKSVNVTLAPLSAMVWGYDKIKELFIPKVIDKLKNIKPEDIIPPKPNIAVPAIEALRYTAHDEILSDLFAGLLASSMDKSMAENTHPGFVEIIKQLSPDEARIIRYMSGKFSNPSIDICIKVKSSGGASVLMKNYSLIDVDVGINDHKKLSMYVDNLCRLGLCEIPNGLSYSSKEQYDPVLKQPCVIEMIGKINGSHDGKVEIIYKCFDFTVYGKYFSDVCIRKN
ncbi:DUF4393 domain-containing protein [Pectobacterium odoriferum]|uniref:DUF4393 domain-containing protein n=1 Tax=Pectobacterium TaxID=122277 RepID=UPI0015DED090|nr:MULTISPECIES: DUF4393 domain-containing protein [Pectobacterium]MBA0176941.1 DUF4393 domain-containing protein [Pectobacterium carotovorum]